MDHLETAAAAVNVRLTDDEVNEKCDALCASVHDRGLCRELKNALWAFDTVDDVADVLGAMARLTAP
jgi:hypothetical protein